MRPAMDFEMLDGLSRDEASAIAVAFLERLEERTSIQPVVYSDAGNASFLFDERVARWPLWAAAYGPEEPDVTANWTAWIGFQYTDRGVVPGVSGYVDRDLFTDEILITRVQPEPEPEPDTIRYTVRRGDTLWALAIRYGSTVSELARINRIANPNLIYAGQQLVIPVRQGSETFVYRIRPGDTLWALSRRYGTTVSELVRLNHIANPDLIYAGRTLRIPV